MVTWMPAHCSAAQNEQAAKQRASKSLSDGTPLERHHVLGNALADKHAKHAAGASKPPHTDFRTIRGEASRLAEVARWIGFATALANHFPAPVDGHSGGRQRFIRDTTA
eukprot:8126986-Karenia_brevis.AAC.1